MASERSKRTPFEILGIPENSTASEIKSAFYAKSKKLHPDVGGDPIFFDILSGAYEEALNFVKQNNSSTYSQTKSDENQKYQEDAEERERAARMADYLFNRSTAKETKTNKPSGPIKEINKYSSFYTFLIAFGVMGLGVLIRILEFKAKSPESVPRKTIFSFIKYYNRGKIKFSVLDWSAGAIEGTVFAMILGAILLNYIWITRSKREGFNILEKILLGSLLVSTAIAGEFFITSWWLIPEIILSFVYIAWRGRKNKYTIIKVSGSKKIKKK